MGLVIIKEVDHRQWNFNKILEISNGVHILLKRTRLNPTVFTPFSSKDFVVFACHSKIWLDRKFSDNSEFVVPKPRSIYDA